MILCVLQYRHLVSVIPGKVEREDVVIQQVLRDHVVHDGSLSSSGDAGVGQAQDAVKLGHHKVLTRLVCAQTNLLVGDHNAANLREPKPTNMMSKVQIIDSSGLVKTDVTVNSNVNVLILHCCNTESILCIKMCIFLSFH